MVARLPRATRDLICIWIIYAAQETGNQPKECSSNLEDTLSLQIKSLHFPLNGPNSCRLQPCPLGNSVAWTSWIPSVSVKNFCRTQRCQENNILPITCNELTQFTQLKTFWQTIHHGTGQRFAYLHPQRKTVIWTSSAWLACSCENRIFCNKHVPSARQHQIIVTSGSVFLI